MMFDLKRAVAVAMYVWLALLMLCLAVLARGQTAGVFKATASSGTAYTVLMNQAGQLYNAATPGFEAEADADWTATKYCLAMTRQGTSQIYLGSMPASMAAGRYSYVTFQEAGGSPALTDAIIAQGAFDWTGAAIASIGISLPANIAPGASGGLPYTNSSNQVAGVSGNVVGSVGSVTGAVGSVTGNIGGISGVTLPAAVPSLTQIETGVWQDATAGDFTTAGSMGLFLKTALPGAAPGATNGLLTYGTGAGQVTATGGYVTVGTVASGAMAPSGFFATASAPGSGWYGNLPNVTIGGYASNEDPASLLFGSTLLASTTTWTAGQYGYYLERTIGADWGGYSRNTTSDVITFTMPNGQTYTATISVNGSGQITGRVTN